MADPKKSQNSDVDVPVGDCPPRSQSLVVIAAIVWGAWFIFLVAMMVERITHAIR